MVEYLEKPFQFLGKERNYFEMKSYKILKIYQESSHFEQKLIKDKDGKMLLYVFDEYVNFNGGSDEINELFVLVEDEADAEQLRSQMFIRREPFLHIGPGFIRAYE